MNETFNRIWYTPAFSSLLENRREGLLIVGAGAAHLGLSLAGLPGWTCPILAATGVPCPGCGLTRATLELLRGDFLQSFQIHAFAPVFLFVLLAAAPTFVLPEVKRRLIIESISGFERRSGVVAWTLSLLMLYWAVRLIA